MKTVSYTDARNRLSTLMESAVRDREPITITRNGAGTVVLLAEEEYSAMKETLHLLSTPANAERIRQGLADYEAGNIQAGELCDRPGCRAAGVIISTGRKAIERSSCGSTS